MAKVKLTKGELKKQRDSLKQFKRYLPTLQLKKQQLQMQINEAEQQKQGMRKRLLERQKEIEEWVGVLADAPEDIDIKQWILPIKIVFERLNIAGLTVPDVKDLVFEDVSYDFYEAPVWMDRAINQLRLYIRILIEFQTLGEKIARLERELQVTSQRVNLFEKVKIPECQDNIRMIRIYLGDQQANAVGVSKVAKKKIEEANAKEEALV